MAKTWRIADRDRDYEHFGLKKDLIEPEEDGQRSDSQPGHYEWWYADAILENKTYVVLVFFTKPIDDQQGSMAPRVSISIAEPGKEVVLRNGDLDVKAFEAGTSACDLRMGDSTFRGNLAHYRIEARVGDVSVTMDLRRQGPSLRLGTGHLLFRDRKAKRFFAWLPSVPRALAHVRYTIGDQERGGNGMGYHDHNWGDAPLGHLMHHWYWARASIGGYTMIAAHIVPLRRFGDEAFSLLYLEKDGQVLAADFSHVRFDSAALVIDPKTLKPFAKTTRYTLDTGQTRFTATFRHARTLVNKLFDPSRPAPENPEEGAAYHRFQGTVTLEINGKDAPQAALPEVPALWELMWLGAVQDGNVLALYAQSLAVPQPKFLA